MNQLLINQEKFNVFLEVSKKLNEIKIIPVLYGSLGLNLVIGEFVKSDDIDVLVPKEYINEKWGSLFDCLINLNFNLKDLHEHEFERKGIVINFVKNDLDEFAGIDLNELNEVAIDGVKFKILSAEHYLRVYSQSRRDDYRIEKMGKQDQEKIERIEDFIKNS